MKEYKIYYEYYPFDVEELNPQYEIIKAENLDEAFIKLEEMKGKGKIEIFRYVAKKYYNEE